MTDGGYDYAICGTTPFAALLAGVGAEVFPSVEAASDRAVREVEQVSPGPDAEAYARMYPRYRALYPALAGEFKKLAALA